MMGGNIPGETRVLSIAIYEHVETLNYRRRSCAGAWPAGLLILSLWLVYRYAGHRFEVVREVSHQLIIKGVQSAPALRWIST